MHPRHHHRSGAARASADVLFEHALDVAIPVGHPFGSHAAKIGKSKHLRFSCHLLLQ
jgi:hypothetical protein